MHVQKTARHSFVRSNGEQGKENVNPNVTIRNPYDALAMDGEEENLGNTDRAVNVPNDPSRGAKSTRKNGSHGSKTTSKANGQSTLRVSSATIKNNSGVVVSNQVKNNANNRDKVGVDKGKKNVQETLAMEADQGLPHVASIVVVPNATTLNPKNHTVVRVLDGPLPLQSVDVNIQLPGENVDRGKGDGVDGSGTFVGDSSKPRVKLRSDKAGLQDQDDVMEDEDELEEESDEEFSSDEEVFPSYVHE